MKWARHRACRKSMNLRGEFWSGSISCVGSGSDHHTAVYGENLPGDKLCLRKVQQSLCHFLGRTVSPEGGFLSQCVKDIRSKMVNHVRFDHTGTDTIYTDVGGAKLLGKGFGHCDEGAFAGRICHLAGGTDLTAFAYSGLQLLTGWYAPPAGTLLSFILCILLDYVIAFTVLGLSGFFASFFKKNQLFGYGFGAFCVCMLRFVCSFLSGAILWGEYITWGFENVWAYSFVYNISYMLPNAILTAVIIIALCKVFNPKTLKRSK